MNLVESAKLLKKMRPYILAGVLIITLSALIYLRYFKKTTGNDLNPIITLPQIAKNPTQKQPAAYKFPDTKNVSIPKQLPVYRATVTKDESINFQELASTFGISTKPLLTNENTHDGKQIIWQQADTTLIISQTNLSYSNYLAPTQGENLNMLELQKIAANFIEKIKILDKSLTLDPNQIVLLRTKVRGSNNPEEELISAESFEKAEFIEFNYKKYLSNLPLYYSTPTSPYLKIRLSKNGTVVYLASRIFQDFSATVNYNLKTLKQAVSEIKNGQGIIVESILPDKYGNTFELYRTQPFKIETLDVKAVYLAYYLSENINEPVQPVFVFEGSFQHEDSQTGKATVFLPAIKN